MEARAALLVFIPHGAGLAHITAEVIGNGFVVAAAVSTSQLSVVPSLKSMFWQILGWIVCEKAGCCMVKKTIEKMKPTVNVIFSHFVLLHNT
jgi:hypothetical protein